MKYEIDKHSGYLMVDRPQRFSIFCPTLYGFVPRTYCGDRVAAYVLAGGPPVSRGDGDPLDICVLTDRPISRGEILLEARPIGGLRMVERGEADDKILAVLLGDPTYGEIADVSSCRARSSTACATTSSRTRRSPATRRTPSRSTRYTTRPEARASSRRRAPTTPTLFPADSFGD